MERSCNALRDFILKEVNARLREWEGDGVEMPPLDGRSCAVGVIDPLKTAGETLCAVLPIELACEAGYITGEARQTLSCAVAFWCRGAQYGELVARMGRYADCFLSCLEKDPSLGGRAMDARATKVGYDCDCGTADRQACACEIELEIRLEEDYSCRRS